MTTIIAGRFMQQSDATQTMAALVKSGFATDKVTSFFISPQGQRDQYPIGGDENESAGTESAGSSAMYGAAGGSGIGLTVGALTIPVLGPAAVVAGAVAGAYVGALVGALKTMETGDTNISPATSALEDKKSAEASTPRKSGSLVAVAVAGLIEQTNALRILRATNAVDIERAEGTITAGEWADFDPLSNAELVNESL